MKRTGYYEPPEYSLILSSLDAILSELNIGMLVYHLEDLGDPSSLKLIYANRDASRAAETDLRRLVGRNILGAFPHLDDTDLPAIYARVVQCGKACKLAAVEYGDARVAQGRYSVRAFPMPQHCVGVLFEEE